MLPAILLSACAAHPPDKPAADPVTTCSEGEVLDGELCVPQACGVGTWGNLPVDGNTVYVTMEAGAGGDGSETAPLASIQAGVDLAGDRGGGLVAVAAGTYLEVIAMDGGHDGVTLGGRCRELVTIDGSEGDDVPAVEIIGGRKRPEIGIEGVTVRGGRYTGLWLQEATVAVSASNVRENTRQGIITGDAHVTLDDVGVSDSRPDRRGEFGRGIDVEAGSALTATGCTIQGNTEIGVYVANAGTVVELVDTEVLDTAPRPDGTDGEGLWVQDGAALATTGCTVQGNTGFGLVAYNAGTSVELVDTEILGTAPSPDGVGGRGVEVQDGASLTATGCTVQGNTEAGVVAADPTTSVDLFDTMILETAAGPDGSLGWGVDVEGGAALTATGCMIQGSTGLGVAASGAGTVVELMNTDILDTAPGLDGSAGVEVGDGAALTATGCTIRANTGVGVDASNVGTAVELVDTAILDIAAAPDGSFGRGVNVESGAALTATGCTVQRSTEAGVVALNAGTVVELMNTDILDTAPGLDGSAGVEVGDGAVLTATGCSVQGNTDIGLFAANVGTVVELADTEVLGTAPSREGAVGVGVLDGAALTATGCTVRGDIKHGVYASGARTSVKLGDTQISNTAPSQSGSAGSGVEVGDGATLTATGCIVQHAPDFGVLASDEGTSVELVDTEILDTAPAPDGNFGRGIHVQEGAALTGTGCTVQGSTEGGVVVSDAGTTVDLVNTAVLDTRPGRNTGFAVGVGVGAGARLTGTDSEISGTEGPGLYVTSGAHAALDGLTLVGNSFAAALITDGSLTLASCTITDTLPNDEWGGGFGVYTTSRFGPPSLTLLDSTIGPHDYAAVWLDGPGTYEIEGNQLSGSEGIDQGGHILHGNALFAENGVTAWDGATGLRLADNTFTSSPEIGVLLDGSSAELDDNSWSDNGTDVRQQACDGPDGISGPDEGGLLDDVTPLTQDDLLEIPNALVCPTGNVLTAYDLTFSTLYLPTSETDE